MFSSIRLITGGWEHTLITKVFIEVREHRSWELFSTRILNSLKCVFQPQESPPNRHLEDCGFKTLLQWIHNHLSSCIYHDCLELKALPLDRSPSWSCSPRSLEVRCGSLSCWKQTVFPGMVWALYHHMLHSRNLLYYISQTYKTKVPIRPKPWFPLVWCLFLFSLLPNSSLLLHIIAVL